MVPGVGGAKTGPLGVKQGRTGCEPPAQALPAGVLGLLPGQPPPGSWALCGAHAGGASEGTRRVYLLKSPSPPPRWGPVTWAQPDRKARQAGVASALQPLCPSEARLRPCRAEPQRAWPSALPTAAPVPRVAPASRKAFKSCDQPPGQQCALALAQPYSGGCGRSPPPQPSSLAQETGLLAGQAGHSPSPCMLPATERQEACSACQKGSGFNPQFQEALCSSSHLPQSRSPGAMGRGAGRCPQGVPSCWAATSQEG